MSVVAVTGARGFLGGHVVDRLAMSGHEVIRIGRNADGELVRLDEPGSRRLLDGVDSVVHLAAMLSLGPESRVAEYLQANVSLSERLIIDAAEAGASAFVFASTRLVYPSDLGRAAVESDAAPDTAYGLSKRMAEMVIAHHSARSDLASVSLRISQLIGPGDGDRGALPRFAAQAIAGEPITVAGSGRAVRDYLDVRDAALAVEGAITALTGPNRDSLAPDVNIGGGPSSLLDLAHVARDAAGPTGSTVVHTDVERDDTSYWGLDASLAERELDWTPQHTLVDALRHRWQQRSLQDRT